MNRRVLTLMMLYLHQRKYPHALSDILLINSPEAGSVRGANYKQFFVRRKCFFQTFLRQPLEEKRRSTRRTFSLIGLHILRNPEVFAILIFSFFRFRTVFKPAVSEQAQADHLFKNTANKAFLPTSPHCSTRLIRVAQGRRALWRSQLFWQVIFEKNRKKTPLIFILLTKQTTKRYKQESAA